MYVTVHCQARDRDVVNVHDVPVAELDLPISLQVPGRGTCLTASKNKKTESMVFTARCYASAVLAMALCLSVSVSLCLCLSQVGVLLKRLNVGSHKQHHTIAQGL